MPNPIKTRAIVESIAEHGTGVYSVGLRPYGAVPRHKPGQFLHLSVGDYDPSGGFWPESRVFSIASAPGAPAIDIVYSVKGRYTRLMEQCLKPGRDVWLKLPYGDFIIDAARSPGQDVVLVAGGTGISPFLPYMQSIASGGPGSIRIRLYYGVRENEMCIGRQAFARCLDGGLADVRVFVENEDPGPELQADARCRRGRLDIVEIIDDSADLSCPIFFLSGPPAMISTFAAKLRERGIEDGRIKMDEWE